MGALSGRVHMRLSAVLVLVLTFVFSGVVVSAGGAVAPGTLDPGFGVGGIALMSFGTGPTKAIDMFVQSDGKYVVLGTYESFDTFPSTKYLTLTRANPDGSIDSGFGVGGTTEVAFSGGITDTSLISAVGNMAQLPQDSGIVVSAQASYSDWSVLRFTSTGHLDTGFGNQGLAAISNSPWSSAGSAPVVAAQADGKLLLGGTLYTDRNNDLAVYRLNADGSLDAAFGQSGLTRLDVAGASQDSLRSLAVTDSGSILAGGGVADLYGDSVLARLTPTGALDPLFAIGGISVHPNEGEVIDIALQTDGSIVTLSGGGAGILRRYSSDGSSLSPVMDDRYNFKISVSSIALQPDGYVLVSGTKDLGYPNYRDLAVCRYTDELVPDAGFGVNGTALTNLGGADDAAAAAVGPDGKLVVASFVLPSGGAAASQTREGVLRGVGAPSQALTRYNLGASPLLKGSRTYAHKRVTAKHDTRGHFRFRVNGITPKATVRIKIFKGRRLIQTIRAGLVATNQDLGCRAIVTAPAGRFVWKVFAVDQNGHKQMRTGQNTLRVLP